jgi:Tfp pilus assembly protein PilV
LRAIGSRVTDWRMRLATRSGFTLVEVLVAVVLIDFALLAIVGASATLLQRETALRVRRAAAQAASNRLAALAAASCSPASGTAQLGPALSESWTASIEPGAVRALRDSVSYVVRGAPHTLVLGMHAPC